MSVDIPKIVLRSFLGAAVFLFWAAEVSAIEASSHLPEETAASIVPALPFDVRCNGQDDDTEAIADLIARSRGQGSQPIVLPPGTCVVTDLVVTGNDVSIRGMGRNKTILVPGAGARAAVFEIASGSNIRISDMTINTTGRAVRNVFIGPDVHIAEFEDVGFVGDLHGDLVFNEGDTTSFINTSAYVTSPETWFLNFARNAHPRTPARYGGNNHSVTGGVLYGGPAGMGGSGIRITQYNGDGNRWRIEGVLIAGWKYISDGKEAISIGNSLFVQVSGCILDQFSAVGVTIADGADAASVQNNWFGAAPPTRGQVGVRVEASAGVQTDISGNEFNNLGYAVQVLATKDQSVTDIGIINNRSWFISTQPYYIDSTKDVVISGNRDRSSAVAGTVGTEATRGDPTGVMLGNVMNLNLPSPYHPAGLKYGINKGPSGVYGN